MDYRRYSTAADAQHTDEKLRVLRVYRGVAGIVKSVTKSDRVEKYPHLSLEVCTYVRTFCMTL